MAPLLISRAPQCVSCIRRVAQLGDAIAFPAGQQVRGKKRTAKIPTVDVQLLQSVPGYGRKGSIVPVTRGIMRNAWFPMKMAEYVTGSKLYELKKENIVPERDPAFGSKRERKAELAAQRAAADQMAAEAKRAEEAFAESVPTSLGSEEGAKAIPSSEEATAIIEKILPRNFDFYRAPITVQPAKQEPAKKLSPSLSAKSAVYAAAAAETQDTDPSGKAQTGTYGSVSTADIAERCRAELEEFPQADSITISPENFRFVDEMEEKNRVKQLGTFGIEIRLSGAERAVRRTITVLAPVV